MPKSIEITKSGRSIFFLFFLNIAIVEFFGEKLRRTQRRIRYNRARRLDSTLTEAQQKRAAYAARLLEISMTISVQQGWISARNLSMLASSGAAPQAKVPQPHAKGISIH
jgi:hypothetical protein